MKLWLIRHAKSDWSTAAQRDFDRRLNPRGERDGPRIAAWLAEQGHAATWIWCSDALRAQATARFVSQGFAVAGPVQVDEHRLYEASPERLLEVIRETPSDHVDVALVAHNPGLTQLTNLLGSHRVTDNLPTFGIARFEVPAPWSALCFGSASLDLLTSPKRIGT